MFIIHAHQKGETKEVKGIEITLVNSAKESTLERYYIYDHGWTNVGYKFIQNGSFKHKGKVVFPRAGNHYVTVFPKHSDSTIRPPVYFARVIWKDDTTYHHLPYERSLDVCSNYLTSKDKSQSLPPMRQENGDVFAPIEIILGQQPIAE
ncbi:MAG: hypothetical protein NWR83_01965, partial [Salibacteraceae bacterium]|nr:hypothetical protein [Salibacteraceae bacterium]